MANQIIVTSNNTVQVSVTPTPTIQANISRASINAVTNVPTANYANFAGNVVNGNQPNITTIGTLTNLNVSNLATVGNLIVTGNFQVGNLVANSANYANFAGIAFSVNGSNVSGPVANANYATNAGNSNFANTANISNVANVAYSVSGGNVSGSVANANYSNFSGTAFSVSGSNVSGTVANANYATNAGNANFANTANISNIANLAYSVSGSNVSGAVANANYADNAGNANIANTAYSVSVGNVVGIGNIATINLDGNASNVLRGDGTFSAESGNLNANYANFAGNAFSVDGANVNGSVANANYSNFAGTAYSVSGANVSGSVANANYSNFAGTAYSVSGSNVSGDVAGANYANFAGNVINAIQSNITAVGNLASLTVVGNIDSGNANLGNIAIANYFSGDGSLLSNINGGNVSNVANANYASYAGDVVNPIQSNITAVGILANLSVSGNIDSGNANLGNLVVANYFSGDGSLLANINGSNVNTVANANYAAYAGDVVNAIQSNITAVGNLASLSVVGNIDSGNANLGNLVVANYFSGDGSLLTNINGSNVNTVANANYAAYAGDVINAIQSNITAVGNLASLSVVGNIDSGNANLGNLATSNFFSGDGSLLSNVTAANITGTVANANYAAYAGNVTVAAQPNITSLGNLTSFTINNGSNLNTYQFSPNGISVARANTTTTFSAIRRGGNTTTAVNEAVIFSTSSATANAPAWTQGFYSVEGGNAVQMASIQVAGRGTANSANLATPGNIYFRAWGPNSNLSAGSLNSLYTIAGDQTFLAINAPGPANTGAWGTRFFGSGVDQTEGIGFTLQRNRGNNTTRTTLLANDYIANIEWYAGGTGGAVGTRPVKISPRIDSGFGNTGTNIPIGIEFQVCNTSANITHSFYSNGNVSFADGITGNGNLTVNNANLGNLATANYFSGNGYYLTGLQSNAIVATYGAFYNPNAISLSANTVYSLNLPNVSSNNGVYIANSSQITVPVAGTYNIQFSIQVKNTDNAADHDIDIWFAKNGTDIPDSASQWTVVKNDGKNICVVNIVDTCTANQYYEIKYAASSANISLEAFSNISTPYTRPAIPSAIVTIVPVGS
jgi:hypothetical protein